MPLDASPVGETVGRVSVQCDARWLMAYAAGVPDERPELYDARAGLVTHPLFPVAPEWELLTTFRATPPTLTRAESMRGVHAAHDVVVERSLRPGETVVVAARVIGVDRRPAGATQQVLLHAVDADGATVWRTNLTSLFRGVELASGPASVDVDWPPLVGTDRTEPLDQASSHVRAVDAHVYTACARIWNPIHTDLAAANVAGLEAPILHGTATLARAVSIVTRLASVELATVRRAAGAFTAVVDLDSTITVRLLDASPAQLQFDVMNARGQTAIRGGFVGIGPSEAA